MYSDELGPRIEGYGEGWDILALIHRQARVSHNPTTGAQEVISWNRHTRCPSTGALAPYSVI